MMDAAGMCVHLRRDTRDTYMNREISAQAGVRPRRAAHDSKQADVLVAGIDIGPGP